MNLPGVPDLLTVREVARLLLVSERTIARAIRRGELPALRVGRTTRIDRGELLAALKRNCDQTKGETR